MNTPATIAYVDDDLVVVNKPAGLLSVPGRSADKQDCLLSRMREQFQDLFVVHRLDRDTSGAILFARNPQTQSAFGRMFQNGDVAKQYHACVEGDVATAHGQIDAPIARVDGATLPPRYRISSDDGRPARTSWTVIQRTNDQTRLLLTPHTGRSHQLRVHCLFLGHPIIGDPIYGRQATRMFLHASRLSFIHPSRNDMLKVDVPLPF